MEEKTRKLSLKELLIATAICIGLVACIVFLGQRQTKEQKVIADFEQVLRGEPRLELVEVYFKSDKPVPALQVNIPPGYISSVIDTAPGDTSTYIRPLEGGGQLIFQPSRPEKFFYYPPDGQPLIVESIKSFVYNSDSAEWRFQSMIYQSADWE